MPDFNAAFDHCSFFYFQVGQPYCVLEWENLLTFMWLMQQVEVNGVAPHLYDGIQCPACPSVSKNILTLSTSISFTVRSHIEHGWQHETRPLEE
jgi:hypothetical protein